MQSCYLVCKKLTDNANTKKLMIKDGRLKIMLLCSMESNQVCGNKKVKYVSKWSGSLDNLVINYKHEQREQ